MTLITTTESLEAACQLFAQEAYITVDTEFLRETTYWPKLCLIQLAGASAAVAIDALAPDLDLGCFYRLMANPGVLKVFHAARQDIEIMVHATGAVPQPIFDTQVAAMVLGFGDQIAYDQLVQRLTGVQIDKSHRFTDWSRRPLSDAQLDYALADVVHLRPVYEKLQARLDKRDRSAWVKDEMSILTSLETYQMDPANAWQRLRGRVRKQRDLAVLMEVCAWREAEAQSRDVPRQRILKDDAVVDIAARAPRDVAQLGSLRSLPQGFERSRTGADILACVERALARDPASLPAVEDKRANGNGSSALIDLLKVLLKKVSEDAGVATKVLATMDDLEAIAANDSADVAALHGWRRELFGEQALLLKKGEVSLGGERGRVVVHTRTPAPD